MHTAAELAVALNAPIYKIKYIVRKMGLIGVKRLGSPAWHYTPEVGKVIRDELRRIKIEGNHPKRGRRQS